MSEKKKSEEHVDDSAHTGSEKHRKAQGPGKVIDKKAMNRGKPGSDERHTGQSPPPRTNEDEKTVVWQTTAQETNPDPHDGSASTAPKKTGAPAKPNTPPENTDSQEGENDKSKDDK